MRVLLLSQYYFPEPVEKVHDLARGLVRLGHDVQVITGFPCYPEGKIYPGYKQTFMHTECLDGVKVTRIPQLPNHSQSAWRRALYYCSFALSAAVIGAATARPADVILVYLAALPVGLSGWIVSRFQGIPLVVDVVDLWPESVIASGMIQNQLVFRLIQEVAKFVYAKSWHIIAVTFGFRRNLVAMGIPEERITVIHNWMPAETYERVEPDPALAQREGLASRFNLMYAGNMGPSQDLRVVIEAAALLTDLPGLQFVLIGDGLQYPDLVDLSHKMDLQNVRFLGRRPPEQMPALYALADVLLAHLKHDSLSGVSIPSKVFAYMASGRPIMMAVQGDAEQFVAEGGFGIAVPPSQPEKIARAARWFYNLPREQLQAMGDNALSAYQNKYSSANQIVRVEEILSQAVRHQNRLAH